MITGSYGYILSALGKIFAVFVANKIEKKLAIGLAESR